jgi:hypothetical protein
MASKIKFISGKSTDDVTFAYQDMVIKKINKKELCSGIGACCACVED